MTNRDRAIINLGTCRIVFFLWALGTLSRDPFEQLMDMPTGIFVPNALGSIFGIGTNATQFVDSSIVVWKTSTGLAAVGLFFPISAAASFISGFILFSVFDGYSCGFHGTNLITIGTGIFMFSYAGRVISIDSFIFRKRSGVVRANSEPSEFEYKWPIFLIKSCWALMFLGAGLSKLRNSGLDYFFDNRFLYAINLTYLWNLHNPGIGTFFKDWLNLNPAIAAILGIGVVIVELSAPIALLTGRVARLVVVVLGLMQMFIYLTMHITSFITIPAVYSMWIPWDKLWESLRQAFQSRKCQK